MNELQGWMLIGQLFALGIGVGWVTGRICAALVDIAASMNLLRLELRSRRDGGG